MTDRRLVAPLILGAGARLFEGLGPGLKLKQAWAVDAPAVTHMKYELS